MTIKKRNLPGDQIVDPSMIDNLEYNNPAGAKKVLDVGPKLIPLGNGAGGYTTNATTIRILGPASGYSLAIYNTDTAVHAVTFGESNTQAALAAGVTDGTGHVGIPCTPGEWTYLSSGYSNYVIADSASLLVFLILDLTSIRVESQNNSTYPGNNNQVF